MRITRVYTRSGDSGNTGLVGGQRVPKDDLRIEAYGTVDELNSIIGICRSFINFDAQPPLKAIDEVLEHVQHELFEVGTDLATPVEARWEGMHRPGGPEVERLEVWCDSFNQELEPLKEFILPGGGPLGASLHHARTVCRRAERLCVTLRREDLQAGQDALKYLNRLSDLLFVLARSAAHRSGHPETLWQRK